MKRRLAGIVVVLVLVGCVVLFLVGRHVGRFGATGADLGPVDSVQTVASPRAQVPGGPAAHVAVIVMENEEYTNVIGSHAAPFINSLASRYALAKDSFAAGHPSLPNYLALTGGSTFGITSDCTDCSVPGTGLGGQLQAAHVSWKAYMENLPHPCFTGAQAGLYAKKHNPFVYFRGIVHARSACRRTVVALRRLTADERSHSLPRFAWITPNLCHDAHDCSLATGDRFLRGFVPPLLKALGPKGLLILTWDEGSQSSHGCCRLAFGGHIVTILAGADAKPHSVLSRSVDHYSTLQLIEDLFGLPRLRGARCVCTPTLQPLLRGP
jgi:acid phosphatase